MSGAAESVCLLPAAYPLPAPSSTTEAESPCPLHARALGLERGHGTDVVSELEWKRGWAPEDVPSLCPLSLLPRGFQGHRGADRNSLENRVISSIGIQPPNQEHLRREPDRNLASPLRFQS